MDQNRLFNKWWLLMIIGSLWMILSYAYLNNTGSFFVTIATMTGFIALLTGCISVIGYFLAGMEEKNISEMILGVCSSGIGILLITSLFFVQEMIIWSLLFYMIINAILLLENAWDLKAEINWWWVTILVFIYTILLSGYSINEIPVINNLLMIMVGFQFFCNGLFLILIALVLRKLQVEYAKTINQIKDIASRNIIVLVFYIVS